LITVNLQTAIAFFYLLFIGSVYVTIILTDLKFRIIPNKIVYPGIIFVLAFMIINSSLYLYLYYNRLKGDDFGVYLLEAGFFQIQLYSVLKSVGMILLSSFLIAAFFALLVWVTKERGMGGGDVKLGFLIGLFNGFPINIVAIFLGFVMGAVTSLVLVLLKIKTLKDTVPFGPFLILGSIISLIWGARIWTFYINLF
jgi:prepilin signal peptidase PulO-like enzyme (type II secretory pathway)